MRNAVNKGLKSFVSSVDQMHNATSLTKSTPPSRQQLSIPGCGDVAICIGLSLAKFQEDDLSFAIGRREPVNRCARTDIWL